MLQITEFRHPLQPLLGWHGAAKGVRQRRKVWGQWVYVMGLRLEPDEWLILMTNQTPHSALRDGALDWKLEPLYGAFKP